jgi:GNAT superfamily N-acetyltransferase
MPVITKTLSNSLPKQLRPFDIRRDMEVVADLIESSFSSTLDPDGRRYLRQMRAAAHKQGVNRWTSRVVSTNSLPLSGFVWEEAGKVVGNLSLVPFTNQGRCIYLIANVAVEPEFRRRGIAQALTSAALEKCRKRYVSATWLQVRHDNPAAINLYLKRGFFSRARRTTWVAKPETLKTLSPEGIYVTRRRYRHWSQQEHWFDQNYPAHVRWNFPLEMTGVRPGLWSWVNSFFGDFDVRHWAVEQHKKLLGIMSWQGSRRYADQLWLAAPPEYEETVLSTVVHFLKVEGNLKRPVSLNYPEGRAEKMLIDLGFEKKATLIWMEVKHGRITPS